MTGLCVANELVDALKRLIVPWKANERHKCPGRNWLYPSTRLLHSTEPVHHPRVFIILYRLLESSIVAMKILVNFERDSAVI